MHIPVNYKADIRADDLSVSDWSLDHPCQIRQLFFDASETILRTLLRILLCKADPYDLNRGRLFNNIHQFINFIFGEESAL